jgi:acyl carrier protein
VAEDVFNAVADIIRRTFSAQDEEIDRSTVSLDIDGWDSLSHARLMLEIERRFRIHISPGESAELGNVGHLVDLVEAKLAAGLSE